MMILKQCVLRVNLLGIHLQLIFVSIKEILYHGNWNAGYQIDIAMFMELYHPNNHNLGKKSEIYTVWKMLEKSHSKYIIKVNMFNNWEFSQILP